MKFFILNIIILFQIFFSAPAFAQYPSYYKYETSNGLPSNEVYDIKQDKQGFLWFGTDAGLVKYDGTNFILYNNNQSRGNAVSCLREDKNGRIWCTNFSGQIFYANADTLALFIPFEKLYKTHYAEIDFDENGNLIVTSGVNELYKFDVSTRKLTVFNCVNNSFAHTPYKAFNKSVLFTGLGKPTQLVRLNDSKLTSVLFETETKNAATFYNRLILTNSYQNKQALCFQVLNQINKIPILFYYDGFKIKEHAATKLLQKLNAYPQAVYDDDDGNLFIGTQEQLYWLKKNKENNWILFSTMFTGNSISCIKKDREGSIWISTLKNGIYKIPNPNVFNLNLSNSAAKSIGVNHLATDASCNIFGSHLSGEVFNLNTISNKVVLINTEDQRDIQTLKYNSYSKNLFICKDVTFIYNTINKSINKASYTFVNAKDLFFTNNEFCYKAGGILNVIFKKDNRVALQNMLNTYDTVYHDYYYLNIASDTWEHIILKEQRCKSVCYIEDTKMLWVGFIDGLAFIKNKKHFYITDPQTNKPIIANQFIYDSITKQLYIATLKQGIFIVKDDKIVKQINTSNGLSSNNIKAISLFDNTIWMACGNKIQAYNLTSHQTKTIDMQDGLLSNEMYDVEVLHDTVYVASSKGVQYFPASIQTHNTVAPISLIQSFVADDSVCNTSKQIELKSSTKNISITMQGIALKSNGTMQFQYRLLPSNANWITVAANQNVVRLSLLSSGKYTFESRVINEDGVASKNISQQEFIISKPWYLQWWFIILSFFVFASLLLAFYKYRLHLQQEKFAFKLQNATVQEELRKSQLASLKSQMNPHFMFNALNSIQEFIILNDKQKANMYMGKFADLMRMTLDMSNKETVSLQDELKCLNLYLELEALRFEDSFTYELSVANNINTDEIHLPSMLIQPYIENAVKHGLLHKSKDRKLKVAFALINNETLNCIIEDNGIGRKRSSEINSLRHKKHTSFATGATQNRLELLNHNRTEMISVQFTDLYDNTNTGIGTIVSINIPV